jgi:hypothetical protein
MGKIIETQFGYQTVAILYRKIRIKPHVYKTSDFTDKFKLVLCHILYSPYLNLKKTAMPSSFSDASLQIYAFLLLARIFIVFK